MSMISSALPLQEKAAGVVFENERKFDLVVRLDDTYRSDIDDVHNLMIPTITGNQIPLSQVANINYKILHR